MNKPRKGFVGGFAGILCMVSAGFCFAGDMLFYKISRNYGREEPQGKIFQQKFEARMFTQARWHERLYISPYEPAIDETVETYSKPDGSRWLSHRRATPSLSRIIEPAPSGEQYDIEKELNAVRISSREVQMPGEVAKEIELLWRTMLPGLPDEPRNRSTTHVMYIHAPAFIAFSRDGETGVVKTGRIAMAAFETPTYKAFVSIVDDLIKVCDRGGGPTDPLFVRLPSKVRKLRADVGGKESQNSSQR